MKMKIGSIVICFCLLIFVNTYAFAEDRINLQSFSVVPPSNWQTHPARDLSGILSLKFGQDQPTALMIGSCQIPDEKGCPSSCDLESIKHLDLLKDVDVSLTSLKRQDKSVEYAGSMKAVSTEGKTDFTTIRMLCSGDHFIFAVLFEPNVTQPSTSDIDSVVDTIEWKN